ncbi:MAG TPA: FAD-dependent oxidoreductase [Terriglobia bacterium]|nr:FAD-dependent oxidoreductase [Terriglobia bacterium]
MKRRVFLKNSLAGLGGAFFASSPAFAAKQAYDVVVYGATASGVVAAVAAARQGARVALLEPGKHLGGMVSGGLGHTDTGTIETIGGISLEFFKRVGRQYNQAVAWDFEPHVAEDVFKTMARKAGVKVLHDARLRERGAVQKESGRITSITTQSGGVFSGQVFIDASYEGDLMAQSGVKFTWGREGRDQYDESFAGVRDGHEYAGHWFKVPVSAYGSRHALLPNINRGARGKSGAADRKVQAYNFRLCLTKDKSNQVAMPMPDNYNPHEYELLTRLIDATVKARKSAPRLAELVSTSPLPNSKTDINNNGAFSTDYIGRNWDYPNANYERRDESWREHADYTAGFFYFLGHDRRVPGELRSEMLEWGLAKDEFTDTGNWPFQLYVRESRRMLGEYVVVQRDLETEVSKPDAIGMGSYNTDSHNVQRYADENGYAQNEGDVEVPTIPFQIPYRALLPKREECGNLLVPVCASASHIGYGALRLEPVYMIMGEAAGVASIMAVDKHQAVQAVDAGALAKELTKHGAVIEWSNPKHLQLKPVP